jgi:hypothetical protein
MQEIIDRALNSYEVGVRLNSAEIAQSRERIAQYIDKLLSAGRTDPDELTECARAYLKEMHEGRDPRFSGC